MSAPVGDEQQQPSRQAVHDTIVQVEETVNPFAYNGRFTLYEAFKALLGIAFVPIKFTLAVLVLMTVWLMAICVTSCGFDENKPLRKWRHCVLQPLRPLARLFMFCFGFFWIDVKGKRAPKSEAPIFVLAPHSTFVDTWLFASCVGAFSGIGKKEARDTPIFGRLGLASQIIPVDREDPDGRKKALTEFVRRAKAADEDWHPFAVFPEGTCTNRKAIIQFKRGSFVPGVPVQPVILRWPYRFFDPSWTSSGPSRFLMILRLLSQFYNRASVEFLPVYYPSEEEKKDADLYASNVRQLMADALGVPTTEHSYEDTFLSMAAKKARFDPNVVVDFEFQQVKKLLGIDLKEARRLLKRFAADSGVRRTGRMDEGQFAKALDLPLTDAVRELFELLDVDEDGTIDYKSFLVGLTFVSQNASVEDGVEVLFAALDPQGSGSISIVSLGSVLRKVFRTVDDKAVARLLASADPSGRGVVDKEGFKTFVQNNPEMLVAGLRIREQYKSASGPLRSRTIKRANKDKRQAKVKTKEDTTDIAVKVDAQDDDDDDGVDKD